MRERISSNAMDFWRRKLIDRRTDIADGKAHRTNGRCDNSRFRGELHPCGSENPSAWAQKINFCDRHRRCAWQLRPMTPYARRATELGAKIVPHFQHPTRISGHLRDAGVSSGMAAPNPVQADEWSVKGPGRNSPSLSGPLCCVKSTSGQPVAVLLPKAGHPQRQAAMSALCRYRSEVG